jgi:2-phosphosulfolactate phosphatase
MEVVTTDFSSGARDARGVVVIIDVLRAATLQCQAFAQGAARVLPVAEEATARQFKATNPDWLLVGERHARKLPGFDHGNSPSEISGLDLSGRTLIHTTHAGTQGLAAARDATVVLSAALVNATATAQRIRELAPERVTLVRMGHEARERTLEDDLCAAWLASLLRGETFDTAGIPGQLAVAPSAQKFFDPACDYAPRADFDICVDVDRFRFALQLEGRQSASPWLAARNPR